MPEVLWQKVVNIFIQVLSSLPGVVALLWQIYDKVIAKPRLIIDVDNVSPRLIYTPESWAWFSDYKRITWCRPYGTIICVPVENTGKTQARNCKAKMRFRVVTLRGDKVEAGDWSKFFELHWSENPETSAEEAYKPISLGRNEVVYVDLLLYHTRLLTTPQVGAEKVSRLHVDPECGTPEIATVLTFYIKPLFRGILSMKPCGWNPSIEFLKLITTSSHDVKRGFLQCYEIELSVTCSNAQAKRSFYLIIVRDSNSLAIYVYSSLNNVKDEFLQNMGMAKPIYRYTRRCEEDPQP